MGAGTTPDTGWTYLGATLMGGLMAQEFFTPGTYNATWIGAASVWTVDAFTLTANLAPATASSLLLQLT